MKPLIGLVVALACGAGVASTIKGNDENCMYTAYNMDNLAMYRDSGIGWLEAKPVILNAIAESMQMPNGLVRDTEDGAYVMDLADKMWNGELRTFPAGVVGVWVYDNCMGKKSKKKVVL